MILFNFGAFALKYCLIKNLAKEKPSGKKP
jgi:hypothetical protein